MNPYLKSSFVPFPNQINNAKALCMRHQALLTDRMGSGKTCSVLFAFAVLKAKGKVSNMVVLTPLSAYEKEVWKKDIQKFTNLKCISLDEYLKKLDNNPQRNKQLLAHYDVIYGKHSHVKNFKYQLADILIYSDNAILTLDECHAFKNPKAAMSLDMKMVTLKAKNIWGITGTSLSRSLEDFYNICNIIKPWYFGSFVQFRETYCSTREKVIGRFNGKLRKALEITGIKNEPLFEKAIEPLVIKGESFTTIKYHWLNYNLDDFEKNIYRRIAKGIGLNDTMEAKDWFDFIMTNEVEEVPRIKSVDLYSSRFLYLQAADDGILNLDGTQIRTDSVKLNTLKTLVASILDKKESCLIYFDYYNSLYCAREVLTKLKSKYNFEILESTGEHVLKDGDLTEAKVKVKPHVVLCTRASAESASLYFINHVIFFHIPTVASTFSQFVGRISRKNTLFPDDLNCHILMSEDIQLYKMIQVSNKAYQMELVQGEESNIPRDYMNEVTRQQNMDNIKKLLLWQN